jgi:hypothetical protein
MLRPDSEFALDSIMPMHCSFISSIIMWLLTGGHIVQKPAPRKYKTCQKVIDKSTKLFQILSNLL